jgi:hypothetical protein
MAGLVAEGAGGVTGTEVRLRKVEEAKPEVEIPRKPIHRQFNIHVGQCHRCHRRGSGTPSRRGYTGRLKVELAAREGDPVGEIR